MKMNDISARTKESNSNVFALCGLIISLFAFCLAATAPWILDELAPTSETSLEETAADMALKIKNHITAKIKGEEVTMQQEETASKHWTDHWQVILISLGLSGLICGIIAFVRHEHKRMSLMAIIMGIAAIIATYAWIAFAVVIFLMLVGMILNQLDFISI